MRLIESLRAQLSALNGKDFMAYQSVIGEYDYGRFSLVIDRIPKDPYAPPGTGAFRVKVKRCAAGFPEELFASKLKRIAVRDFLARQFYSTCHDHCPGRRGTGSSGIITIAKPDQEILERTSVMLFDDRIEVRFFIGMPAKGRKINAKLAEKMLFAELPNIVESSLYSDAVDLTRMKENVHTAEDVEHLRSELQERNLVAFIADGSILPRVSGIDARPLKSETVVPFKSPDSLAVELELPHGGKISGMGIPKGVTLIVGGGYHGKSTLLQTIELGVYNHIPGDGRELCVALPSAMKVRAYSGRSVSAVDISMFINNLPQKQDTKSFSTQNASGSTSQAASIAESIEAGTELMLMDEDTCAANLMIRDSRMQQLVAREQEPITTFLDRVRQIYSELGISTILVMGGSGDYFDVGDCVIQMNEFQPLDVTLEAREVAKRNSTNREAEGSPEFGSPITRRPLADGFDPRNEYGHFRINAPGVKQLVYGRVRVDLSDVEQLTETAQTRAIGRAIESSKRDMNGKTSLNDLIQLLLSDIDDKGLDILDERLTGDLAWFRSIDFAAAINRFRGLKIQSEN